MKSRKQPWQKLQDRVISDIQGSDSVGSGRFPPYKYDIIDRTNQIHIECKCYSSNRGRVLKKWVQKTVNECAMSTAKYPAVIMAYPLSINDYVAYIDSSIAEVITIPHLYGYPEVTGAAGMNLGAHDASFRIKEPGSKHFFNTIRIPLKHRTIELLAFDRRNFIELTKRLRDADEPKE